MRKREDEDSLKQMLERNSRMHSLKSVENGRNFLVRENDVGENRSLEELELATTASFVLLDHLSSRDVGGHQVRSELDPVKVEA